MNRGYTASQYLEFVDRARAFLPDVSLASDFIVGFPTETDADFDATVELTKRCRFKNSFIFKYSPRPGTTAIDRFTDDVPEDVKRRRNHQLLAVQAAASAEGNRALVGKTVEVLVEGQSRLAAKPAYPSSNVELGWEKRRPGVRPRHHTVGRPHPRRSDRRLRRQRLARGAAAGGGRDRRPKPDAVRSPGRAGGRAMTDYPAHPLQRAGTAGRMRRDPVR